MLFFIFKTIVARNRQNPSDASYIALLRSSRNWRLQKWTQNSLLCKNKKIIACDWNIFLVLSLKPKIIVKLRLPLTFLLSFLSYSTSNFYNSCKENFWYRVNYVIFLNLHIHVRDKMSPKVQNYFWWDDKTVVFFLKNLRVESSY